MTFTDIPTITLGLGDYVLAKCTNEDGFCGVGFQTCERHPVGTPVCKASEFNPFMFLAFSDVKAIESFQNVLEELKKEFNEVV